MDDKNTAVVEAIINKIQTTADGGARLTLDLGYESSEIIAQLLQNKLSGTDLIYIAFINSKRK